MVIFMSNKKIQKEHKEFLKKLKVKYPLKINKFYTTKNIGKINRIFYSKGRKIWFAHSENENKYFYIFGIVNSTPDEVSLEDYTLIYDFPKNEIYNKNCLGMINKNNLYIIKNTLIKKYPNFNLNNLSIKKSAIFQGTYINIETVDLGNINGNFIDNIEKIIKEIDKIKPLSRENLFLNSIKAGKTVEESLKIAKISKEELDLWLESGKNNNKKYAKFYKKYNELITSGISKTANDNLMTSYYDLVSQYKAITFDKNISKINNIKMNVFLDEYNKNKKLNYSLKKANLNSYEFNSWIEKGKDKSSKYNKFYNEYIKIKETPKIKKDMDKISKNNEEMEKFIKLKHEGKTNKEALEKVNIPQHLLKNWINQGKLGNIKYSDFYWAYMIDDNSKSKTKEKTLPEYDNKQQKDKKTPNKCDICGRTLNKNSEKNICKRCLRKQYAVTILEKLLPSIEPGIPFRQDDLKLINLKKLQIQDYIWTLQEFNLITKENSKYIIKSRSVLDKFAKECNLEINITEKTPVSLSKTCKTCGETLEISNFYTNENNNDGYEDNCKKCKKLIKSAIFLKQLNKYVKWEDEFSEKDLKPYFKDSMQLKGNIWNLLENDLIKNKFNTQNYILTDEKTGLKFIEKYYKKEYDTPIEPQQSKETKKSTNNNQREIVLDAMSRRRTRKEASIIANIPLYKITHWFNEGRQGFGNENIKFYNQLRKTEMSKKPYSINEIKKQIDVFIQSFKENKSIEKACEESNHKKQDINDWIILGENNIYPYNEFLIKYNQINNTESTDEKSKDYESVLNQAKRKIFLEYVSQGFSDKDSCGQASLDQNTLKNWLSKGKTNEKPYVEFFNKYTKIKREITRKTEDEKIQNEIIEMINNGLTIQEAAKEYKKGSYEKSILSWYEYGKMGDEKYIKFYEKCKEVEIDFFDLIKQGYNIKSACEESDLDFDYVKNKLESKEDEFYNRYMESKILNKIKDYPIVKQEKTIGSQSIIKLMNKILKLLVKGRTEKEACEIVDFPYDTYKYWLNRGKQGIGEIYVNFYHEINQINKIISSIENELNEYLKTIEYTSKNVNYEKYKDLLKPIESYSAQSNRTGFGWTNKIGNKWIYTKSINKKQTKITDENLYILYEKVLESNNIWGVIDKEKAIETLRNQQHPNPNWDIETFLKLYDNLIKDSTLNQENEDEIIAKDILDPLPKKFEEKFSAPSKTGFAWVSQSWSKWSYSKSVNGSHINIRKDDINELFEEVCNFKLTWGVRDKNKALKSLEENKNKNKNTEPKKVKIIQMPDKYLDFYNQLPDEYKDILKPLDMKYEELFIKPSKTGFAWVEKPTFQWVFSRSINGNQKYISNKNIFQLYDEVLKNNYGWGVRDYDKAIHILKEELNQKITNTPTSTRAKTENDILINYLSSTDFDINILIKGLINENDLFNILDNFKYFENNITRILTNKINNKIDILIELNLEINLLSKFEKEMSKLGWKILDKE